MKVNYSLIGVFIALSLFFSSSWGTASESFKVLHVMSYHHSWKWNKEQLRGFQDALEGLNVEYKVVELDTKRISNPEAIAQKVAYSKQLIAQWQPDLLYTNDDAAQKYLAKDYAGTQLPIVFSGVNRNPSEYGFLEVDNVTGVIEYEHFMPTLNFLKQIQPNIKKIAVILDQDPTWKGVIGRMKASLHEDPTVKVVDWIEIETFADYKATITKLQDQVDAIALLGIFNIKDEDGENIDYKEVLKWTVANSQLPDFSFWEHYTDNGALCSVVISGYQQGLIAGQMAEKILHDKISPSSIEISKDSKGLPIINFKRARSLGLKIDVGLLLKSTVKKKYAWEP